MNGEVWKKCGACGGAHVGDGAHVITGPDGSARYYCAPCWPEAIGLHVLKANAIAAAHKGAVAERWAEIVTTLGALAGGNAADRERYRAIAARILDEIAVAGVEAGKRGW